MAKKTLLEMVQSILPAIGSDQVSDINGTSAAEKVTRFIQEVYEQEIAFGDWGHLKFLGQLTGIGDTASPTVMKIPDNVAYVDKLRYTHTDANGNLRSAKLTFIKDTDVFLERLMSRNSSEANVVNSTVPSIDSVSVLVYNDRNATFWTVFDDEYVVMDAYDASVEATVQGSKSLVTGKRETLWQNDKDFVPDLPSEMFPHFLARCTVVAAERLSEKVAAVDRQAEQRGRAYQRHNGGKTDIKYRKQKYGRK